MKNNKRAALRTSLTFILLMLALAALVVWNINSGSVRLSAAEVFRILFLKEGDAGARDIIWQIRLPRILAAGILGGALSVSGFLLQTFFHNPIAGPFVLGISSGAKLVVAFVMIFLLSRGHMLSSAGMVLAAFAGAMLSTGFVLAVSGKVRSMSTLVICGVMISYICSAITDFVVAFADDADIVNLHNWSMGSFASVTWNEIGIMCAVILPSFLLVFLLSKPAGAYQLGEAYAQSLGVNIRLFRVCLILLSSLLSAAVTAFAGPVSFVGIAVPHLLRNLMGTSRPILMTPACILGGAVFCLFSDLIARTLYSPMELSISSVTALFGAPVVIWLMIRRKRAE
ncbi:MAG: iron ABC transporter permease [Lachnospiraceae bacterium]|nr:iron ABC transporter permease [Lachnospiraceae bacterium]